MYLELTHEGSRWRVPVDRVDGFGGLLQVWPASRARLSSLDHGGVAFGGLVPMPHAGGRTVAVLIRPRAVGADWRVYSEAGALILAIDDGHGISDIIKVRRVEPCRDGVMVSGSDQEAAVERPDSMGKYALWTVQPDGGDR